MGEWTFGSRKGELVAEKHIGKRNAPRNKHNKLVVQVGKAHVPEGQHEQTGVLLSRQTYKPFESGIAHSTAFALKRNSGRGERRRSVYRKGVLREKGIKLGVVRLGGS